MVIEIHIHRPRALLGILLILCATATTIITVFSGSDERVEASALATGGTEDVPQLAAQEASAEVRHARQQRAVLQRKEEILRYQLQVIEDAFNKAKGLNNAALLDELSRSRQQLVQLLKDKRLTENKILASLAALWEAEERAGSIAAALPGDPVALAWPVDPVYGLSADFLDEEYEAIFGLPHHAIDIPVPQGTLVRSPADGVVERVADNGFGYSYLILRHQGVVTVYGHIEEFLVKEGDQVVAGDLIARSGGRPGSRGAGALTTGPHLHFETIVQGEYINPEVLLPKQ